MRPSIAFLAQSYQPARFSPRLMLVALVFARPLEAAVVDLLASAPPGSR